jgi:putative ABC transport system permease protein
MVIAAETVPTPRPAPDFYLAHLAGGRAAHAVAARLRRDVLGNDFSVATISQRVELQQRGLTALNLDGLSAIETAAAGLIAALGVGVLGAFLVLERGREFAVLRTLGANTRQVLTGPALEGAVAIVGSVAIGVPLGLGLGVLAVRVLALFFTLPPPLLTVPTGGLLVLGATVLVLAAASLAIALWRVSRVAVGVVLREP